MTRCLQFNKMKLNHANFTQTIRSSYCIPLNTGTLILNTI